MLSPMEILATTDVLVQLPSYPTLSQSVKCPLIPHQGVVIIALLLKSDGHVVDDAESVRVSSEGDPKVVLGIAASTALC